MTLLSIKDLSVSIHGKPIIRNVSFKLGAGEILALTGESGSGKSVSALALMGLLPYGSYTNHVEQAREQLTREPRPLPQMWMNPDVKDLFAFTYDDFKLLNYDPHPHIKAAVAV